MAHLTYNPTNGHLTWHSTSGHLCFKYEVLELAQSGKYSRFEPWRDSTSTLVTLP